MFFLEERIAAEQLETSDPYVPLVELRLSKCFVQPSETMKISQFLDALDTTGLSRKGCHLLSEGILSFYLYQLLDCGHAGASL